MKSYTPEKLVAISRYRNYFPTLPAEIRQDVYQRMRELLLEEQQYCDKGNYKHIAQILTSIALYRSLQAHGRTEEEAYQIVSTEMWKALTPDTYQKLARKSWFLPAMKKILPFGFRHGSGVGWRYEWHLDEDPKDRFHFECRECIYWHIFKEQEILSSMLASYHNIYFLNQMIKEIREAIREDRFVQYREEFLKQFHSGIV